MVNSASALGRNGVHDWILLRAAAIIIMLYVLYVLCFIMTTSEMTYEIWRGFFTGSFIRIFTVLTLCSVLIHTWIGIWQILTDYIKLLALRLTLQLLTVILLLSYLLYGTMVMWDA